MDTNINIEANPIEIDSKDLFIKPPHRYNEDNLEFSEYVTFDLENGHIDLDYDVDENRMAYMLSLNDEEREILGDSSNNTNNILYDDDSFIESECESTSDLDSSAEDETENDSEKEENEESSKSENESECDVDLKDEK